MNNKVASIGGIPKSCKTQCNQTISHVASHADMYSASTEEVVVVAFFLQLQDTAVDPMFITGILRSKMGLLRKLYNQNKIYKNK